ncbi:MAG: ribonuclease P protein component [Microbacteriaceae bacterium]
MMLARQNRVITADDFRATVRRGRRFAAPHTVVYAVEEEKNTPARFGFIITKSVGGAVERNLIRRRLRSIVADRASDKRIVRSNIVVRVLPGATDASWLELRDEVTQAIDKWAAR